MGAAMQRNVVERNRNKCKAGGDLRSISRQCKVLRFNYAMGGREGTGRLRQHSTAWRADEDGFSRSRGRQQGGEREVSPRSRRERNRNRNKYKISGMGRENEGDWRRERTRNKVQVQGREDNWRSGTSKSAAGHFTSSKEKLRKKLRFPAKTKKKKMAVRCVLSRP